MPSLKIEAAALRRHGGASRAGEPSFAMLSAADRPIRVAASTMATATASESPVTGIGDWTSGGSGKSRSGGRATDSGRAAVQGTLSPLCGEELGTYASRSTMAESEREAPPHPGVGQLGRIVRALDRCRFRFDSSAQAIVTSSLELFHRHL